MKNIQIHKVRGICTIMMLFLFLYSCTEDPVRWSVDSEQQVIADYVANNPDKYSEFNKLLESANLTALLSVRGPFTLFIPNNDAMKAYYKEIGVNDQSGMTDKQKKDLAYNHLINNSEIRSGDIGLGALRDTNCVGDFIATEFVGSDIMLNKRSKITNRDIICANGYVHEIDNVIAPLTQNIFDMIKADGAFKLFTQGLELTGLKDTLQVLTIPWGKKSVRVRFTVLAVPDTTYNRYGINTIDELIAYFTDSPDSVSVLENDFYRYMEYHCMSETYFLSSFETKLYPILSFDNNISMTVNNDYKLNLVVDKVTKKEKYTGFIVESSNIPAKNGAFHVVNDLLPVIQPDPVTFVYDICDQFEIKQMDCYGKYYGKFYDGQNTFARVKWQGDFLQYYYKNHDAPVQVKYDGWQMFGFGWIEVTTPKIMKGNYKVSGYLWGKPSYEVYIDGVKKALIAVSDPDTPPWGEVSWDKTEAHKIKIVTVTWGTTFWDTVIFTPIN
jgi:uncharacterized surface protein with fasciclin (FAS1) repeats